MYKIKNQVLEHDAGITLVALIITIIVLIILAAVSIKAVLDMNFVDLASNAVLNYAEAQAEEEKNMNDIDDFLQSTIKKIEDEDFNTGGGDNPNPSDTPNPTTEPTPVPTPTGPDMPVIPEASNNVNYVPESGTYPKATLDKYSGNTNNNDFTTDTSLKWKVWSIDDNNLYLISDRQISTGGYNNDGELYLSNPLGYNNGVTLLDQICSTCYSNSSYSGLTARSLKLEDVLAVTTVSNSSGSNYGTQPHEYLFTYPYIWTEYEGKTKENAINNKSIAYGLTTKNTTAQARPLPYWTLWYNSSMNTTSAYKHAKYKELITDVASSRAYWLSSRYVHPYSSSACYFGLQCVHSSGVGINHLFYYYSGHASEDRSYSGVRPFITIPLSSCTITEVDANNWTIAPKS